MSWPVVALIVGVLAVVVVVALIATYLGVRLFALLNPIIDRWRPTASGESRPGHDHLGVGLLLVVAPVVAILWYDLAPALAQLPQALSGASFGATVSLLVVILTPLLGMGTLLSWKNTRLQQNKSRIRLTSVLGQQTEWLQVISISVEAGLRGVGTVWFEAADGWRRADTTWINIRNLYEALAASGVTADPWPQTTKGQHAAD